MGLTIQGLLQVFFFLFEVSCEGAQKSTNVFAFFSNKHVERSTFFCQILVRLSNLCFGVLH